MSVFRFFENLSDPRAYNQKHHFLDIVFLVVSAVISGANSWTENKAHWVLDVVYKEDECAVTDEWGAENLAILRRLALNLARLHPKKQSMKGKLTAAGWSDEFRDELLLGV